MSDPTRLTVGPGELDNLEFGEVLDRLRIAANLSRAQAAAQIEVTSEYLRLIERGKRTPALGTMPKLLESYGVSFQMDRDKITFGRYSVRFTSRIREARYKAITENPNRDVRLGQIVRLLVTVDDDTLRDIYRRLLRA